MADSTDNFTIDRPSFADDSTALYRDTGSLARDTGSLAQDTNSFATVTATLSTPPEMAFNPNRPGFLERLVVVAALFVFYHQTPNAWFINVDETVVSEYSNPLAAVVQLGLIGLALVRVIGNFDEWIRVIRIEPAVFAFALWAMSSVLWSANVDETLRRSVVLMAVTFFASYLVMRFYLDETLELFSWMFCMSAAVNMAFVLAFPAYGINDQGEWSGVFTQKNSLGYITALSIPTLLVTARARPRWRFVFYLGLVLNAYLLIGSESKTMLLVGFGSCLLLVLFNWFRARRTLRGAVIVGIGASAALSLAFATANLALLADWIGKDVTLTGRVPMWEGLWPIAMERWLIGWGYEAAFGSDFSPAHEVLVTLDWDPGDSHNAILQILLELGLVGLVIFMISYLRGVSRAITVLAITRGAVALWPITIFAMTTLLSITESGIQSDSIGWTLYVVAVLWAGAGVGKP